MTNERARWIVDELLKRSLAVGCNHRKDALCEAAKLIEDNLEDPGFKACPHCRIVYVADATYCQYCKMPTLPYCQYCKMPTLEDV